MILDENAIHRSLTAEVSGREEVSDVLAKALELKGLDCRDINVLAGISDPEQIDAMYAAAREVKDRIYGRRLVLFAPLYVSSFCGNECIYCAFRAGNRAIKRRALTQDEIASETGILVSEGHKRVLLVAGEDHGDDGFRYVLRALETVYGVRRGHGGIRRVNVNIAPLDVGGFRELKDSGIGTYQLFQETYHSKTYERVHRGGRKRDYQWRITAMDRAMEAGIDDVGIGVLFGLYDWRFEIMAMMQHVRHLEGAFGTGPHTISVPRLEPASGSKLAGRPPHPVSDGDFRKIVAILRLAVPYTGIIMSTRETPEMRRDTFSLGVSQISAGSRTDPGGYGDARAENGQFSLGDQRPLDEVIRDIVSLGYVPSFCTGCYRLGRTGKDFMDLAKPGEIRRHCDPNAVSTFMEYCIDYASAETAAAGIQLIGRMTAEMDPPAGRKAREMLEKVRGGARDVFC